MAQQQRLSDAIDQFLLVRTQRKYAKNTIKSQRTILLRLLTETGNIYVASLTDQHLEDFFAAQEGRWGDGTTNLARTHLVGFFKFCRARGWMGRDRDPLADVRRLKLTREQRMRVPVGEFPRLLDVAGERHPRDRALVALGLFLFLRAGEATTLKVGDVHFDRDEVTVRVFKSNIVDNMPISQPLRVELKRWLTYYTAEVGELRDDMYLVPGLRTHPGVYDPQLRRLVNLPVAPGIPTRCNPYRTIAKPADTIQRALTELGYPVFKEGCHTLRRSGARALFDELCEVGFDRALEIVSTMLHHEQMGTTQIYLGLQESKVRRDSLLKGQPMFTGMANDNVISLADRGAR